MSCIEKIAINPTKLMFARRNDDFVRFHVAWDKYWLSDYMLRSINEFILPEQPSLADIPICFREEWIGVPFFQCQCTFSSVSQFRDTKGCQGRKVC